MPQRFWRMATWKDKILDYEIEIWSTWTPYLRSWNLEKIRFSITRLKSGETLYFSVKSGTPWKDKILDYEIEIIRQVIRACFVARLKR